MTTPSANTVSAPARLTSTPARLYRALIERDAAFDGRAVVGVKTTGIFCRFTCTARKPRRENVEFFGTPREAMFAGYRSCKRCRPMEDVAAVKAAPGWLVKLKREADEKPTRRLRDGDLRTRGLDPSTVRRLFQSHYGSTFQQYARARRMGLALSVVRAGRKFGEAKMQSGLTSDSGFREAFAKLCGAPPKRGEKTPVLLAGWVETPLGPLLALADDAGLRVLDFVDRRGVERQIERLRARLKCVIVPGEHEHLSGIERELTRYFAGKSWLGHGSGAPLGVPLNPQGTPFQEEVWAELRRIPLGQTRSYAQQAAAIGKREAVRAVARANGENFLAIVIPCHRVIGADGSLTGYGGGLWRKQWLLDHEKKMAGLTLV
jgi:AraC family transcriptional regulator, regulatory protein of adaptative response / methylated-DNA-[protein]-cysteine methyltransferase